MDITRSMPEPFLTVYLFEIINYIKNSARLPICSGLAGTAFADYKLDRHDP